MDSHMAHHKIKAEWTRSSTNEAIEETDSQASKNLKSAKNKKCAKIKIIEQIVLRPSNEEVNLLNKPALEKDTNKKIDDTKSKKCQICEKSFAANAFDEHIKSHGFFECNEPNCMKKFKRKSSLRKHTYIHKGKFKYKCDDCKETFIDKCKFHIHVASKHKKVEQIYECKECDKTFTSADYLRRHQITHKDEYPYPCTVCPQKFKWFTSLQAHNLIHTQNKTIVQCQICFKRFFAQRTLDRHMKIHQNTKYHCKICNSVISIRKDNIMRHIRHLHNEIPRSEVGNYISTVEEPKIESKSEELKEIEILNEDDDSTDLIIDETRPEENEQEEIQQPVINNRVNVIQSIGNPNKNQQQSPQNITSIEKSKTDEITNNQLPNGTSNSLQPDKADNEIQLPPKKKAIAKYNPIEHYRKILGLSELNTSSTATEIEESTEQVFPDHWRKRTSQNFLFRR